MARRPTACDFHLRRSIAIVAGRPDGLPSFIGGAFDKLRHPLLRWHSLSKAPISVATFRTGASVLCTPSGVRAPVAKRQSTENTHAVRCAGKKRTRFSPLAKRGIFYNFFLSLLFSSSPKTGRNRIPPAVAVHLCQSVREEGRWCRSLSLLGPSILTVPFGEGRRLRAGSSP